MRQSWKESYKSKMLWSSVTLRKFKCLFPPLCVRWRHFKVLFCLMSMEDECLECSKGTKGALELWWFAFMFQVVAPHLVEFTTLCTSIAEHCFPHEHLPIGWKQKSRSIVNISNQEKIIIKSTSQLGRKHCVYKCHYFH